jgi:GT2 family glycosyltransferase
MPSAPPSLTVSILNYRDAEATVRCLGSVAASAYDGELRILLVENGSGDGSRERLEEAAARCARPARVLVSDRNLGFAGGHNLAWHQARTEFVCFLNNDATVHPDCLRRLVETLVARPDLGAVWPYDAPAEWGERREVPDAAHLAKLRNGTYSVTGANIWLPLLRDYRECFAASGVCLAMRRSAVEQPFLDVHFMYYEDVYLGWRLRLRGLGAERVPEAVIYHEGSVVSRHHAELRPLFAFHAEKNRLMNLLLFYEGRTLLALAPLLALDELKRYGSALARLARPDGWARLTALVRSRWWIATHLGRVRAERRVVQSERAVPDRDIVAQLSGRLTAEQGAVARLLNAASLTYCRLVGLRVCERRGSPTPAK